jgi:hypothetical protein
MLVMMTMNHFSDVVKAVYGFSLLAVVDFVNCWSERSGGVMWISDGSSFWSERPVPWLEKSESGAPQRSLVSETNI